VDYRDEDFDGKTVVLDGNTFTGCTFRNCTIVYRASASIHVAASHFKENVNWTFQGSAKGTLDFLRFLCHSCGEGGKKLFEGTCDEIRRNPPADNPRR
jgi:hypothetical protein